LRAKKNLGVLWSALVGVIIRRHGSLPFDTEQKLLGKDAFTNIPNGSPEWRIASIFSIHTSKRGRLEIERFVDAASTRPAKLFGLFPRKETIAIAATPTW